MKYLNNYKKIEDGAYDVYVFDLKIPIVFYDDEFDEFGTQRGEMDIYSDRVEIVLKKGWELTYEILSDNDNILEKYVKEQIELIEKIQTRINNEDYLTDELFNSTYERKIKDKEWFINLPDLRIRDVEDEHLPYYKTIMFNEWGEMLSRDYENELGEKLNRIWEDGESLYFPKFEGINIEFPKNWDNLGDDEKQGDLNKIVMIIVEQYNKMRSDRFARKQQLLTRQNNNN